jgi:hypothetical protein
MRRASERPQLRCDDATDVTSDLFRMTELSYSAFICSDLLRNGTMVIHCPFCIDNVFTFMHQKGAERAPPQPPRAR